MLDQNNQRNGRPLRVATLVRVSTTHVEQADSPQHQLSYVAGAISNERWVDSGLVYQAELTGAVIINRPDIQRMFRDAEAGYFDAIVLKSISRLGRDVLGLLMVKRMLDDQRVELIALADSYRSFRDPELIFLVHAERAQAGRQEIAKNVRTGIVEAAKRGIWPGGTLPFGLRKESRFQVVRDPDTAPLVRLIFELRQQNWGPVKISHHLNNEVRRKAPEWWHIKDQIAVLEATDDKDKDSRIADRLRRLRQRVDTGSFLWYPKTIRVILSNTAYYGELRYNRTTGERKLHGKLERTPRPESDYVVIGCPPVVSREEWEQAQAVGEARRGMPRKSLGSSFLLSGLISCGRCGCSMRGSSARPGAGKRGGDAKGYYVCRGAIEAGAHAAEYIRATALEQAVIERLRDELAPLEQPEVRPPRRSRKPADPAREVAAVEASIRDLGESKFFRREELRKGRMSEAEFDFEIDVIRTKEEELRTKLEQVKRGRAIVRDEELRLVAIREAASKLMRLEGAKDHMKTLLATLVRKVIVHSSAEVEVHASYTLAEIATYHSAAD